MVNKKNLNKKNIDIKNIEFKTPQHIKIAAQRLSEHLQCEVSPTKENDEWILYVRCKLHQPGNMVISPSEGPRGLPLPEKWCGIITKIVI